MIAVTETDTTMPVNTSPAGIGLVKFGVSDVISPPPIGANVSLKYPDAKEEWKAEVKDEMAMKLMESGVALDIIQKCSGLDDVGMAKLISKYNDLKGTDVTIK